MIVRCFQISIYAPPGHLCITKIIIRLTSVWSFSCRVSWVVFFRQVQRRNSLYRSGNGRCIMVPSFRSALTTCIALVVVGIEARKTRGIGPSPAASDRYRPTMFSLAAMSVFLFLSACAEAPTPQPRASLPTQRNVSAPAPDPCAVPNTGQTDARNTVYGPQLRPTDRRCPDYTRGFPSLGADGTWPRPTQEPFHREVSGRTQAERYWEAERFRQEKEDFQRRQRTGR
jgi:hypothetical protein